MNTSQMISDWDRGDRSYVVEQLRGAPASDVVAFVMALYDGYVHDVAVGEAKKLKYLLACTPPAGRRSR